jgi:hypothetical protein
MRKQQPETVVAKDREEHESCEAGTQGCCVDHTRSGFDSPCQPW